MFIAQSFFFVKQEFALVFSSIYPYDGAGAEKHVFAPDPMIQGGLPMLPQDPAILASYINMKLRDGGLSLQEFCEENDLSREELEAKLASAGFCYDERSGSFR